MPRVIQINRDCVSVGMDDGSIADFAFQQFNFTPAIGDEVEIFQNENRVIITKAGQYSGAQSDYSYSDQTYYQQPYTQDYNNNNTYYPQNNNNQNVVINNNINYGVPKDKWIAFLLCLLFGTLGIHKFYEGKIGMGILYIFTVGLCGIGVLVDLITILMKPNPYYV